MLTAISSVPTCPRGSSRIPGPPLRRRVQRRARTGDSCLRSCDENRRSVRLTEVRNRRSGRVEHPVDVHAHDGPILVGGELLDGRLESVAIPALFTSTSRRPNFRDRLLDGRPDLVFVAHVRGTDERRRVRLGFDFGREFRQPILSTGRRVRRRHRRTRVREPFPSDSRTRAGNDRSVVCQWVGCHRVTLSR